MDCSNITDPKIPASTEYKGYESRSSDYISKNCNRYGDYIAVPTDCKLNTPFQEQVFKCVEKPTDGFTLSCPDYNNPNEIPPNTNVTYVNTSQYGSKGCAPGTYQNPAGAKCYFRDFGNYVYDCVSRK